MKKWILVILLALTLSGCSVTSLLLYADELQQKITEFENSSNQFVYNLSSLIEVSASDGFRTFHEENLTYEYQKTPYYLHYDNTYIETEQDGVRKYYLWWPLNIDNKNMYREVEPKEIDLTGTEIKTKKLIILKKNESTYTLEGELEHFLTESELTELYEAIHELMPDKDLENNVRAKMTITFSDFMLKYSLSFEVTETFNPEDMVIILDVNLNAEVHKKVFDVIDVTSDDRFFPAPDSESLVEVDAYKPIYFSPLALDDQIRYKIYLVPGNYVVNSSNSNFLNTSTFDIRSLDDSISYRLFPDGQNLTRPLNQMFGIKEAGYYCFITDYDQIGTSVKVQLQNLDSSLLNLTRPEITVTGTGEYNYRFTEPYDIITVKFDVPVGSIIQIRSDFNPSLAYQKPGDDLFTVMMLGDSYVSLTQSSLTQLAYLTYNSSIVFFGKLYITVNTPA